MVGGKPSIVNVSMASANTEYSYAVPAGVNKVLIKLRSSSVDLKLSYTSGESGTTYLTVPAGSAKSIDDIKGGGGLTLYFQAASASQTLEVEIWK
jgi:hypothetical protein